jgi:hypothetical protein
MGEKRNAYRKGRGKETAKKTKAYMDNIKTDLR